MNKMRFHLATGSLYLIGVGLIVATIFVTGAAIPLGIAALSVLSVAMVMNLYDKITHWNKTGTFTVTKLVFQVMMNVFAPAIIGVGVFATPALIVGSFLMKSIKNIASVIIDFKFTSTFEGKVAKSNLSMGFKVFNVLSSITAAVFLGLVIATGIASAPVTVPVLIGLAIASFGCYAIKMCCKAMMDFNSK